MAEQTRPSPARLRRALAAGDSPLSAFSVRVASLSAFALLLPALGRALRARFDDALRAALAHPESAAPGSLVVDTASLVAPILAVAAIAALAVGGVQTGFAVTFRRRESLLARLFDSMRLFDAARTVLLAAGVALIGWYALAGALPALANDAGRSGALLDRTGNLAGRIAAWSLCLAFALAAGDIVVRRAAWLHKQSPSPEEAKRERRETEGDPQARRARRRIHEELTRAPDP